MALPLAVTHLLCSAALAVIETLDKEDLIASAETKGKAIASGLTQLLRGNNHVTDIRHKGLDDRHRTGCALWRTGTNGAG